MINKSIIHIHIKYNQTWIQEYENGIFPSSRIIFLVQKTLKYELNDKNKQI